jgi:hypothetical protein
MKKKTKKKKKTVELQQSMEGQLGGQLGMLGTFCFLAVSE